MYLNNLLWSCHNINQVVFVNSEKNIIGKEFITVSLSEEYHSCRVFVLNRVLQSNLIFLIIVNDGMENHFYILITI